MNGAGADVGKSPRFTPGTKVPSLVAMKKSTLLAAAALTGFGAALVAPTAVADPRISVPFVPRAGTPSIRRRTITGDTVTVP